ncbi:PilZ domain-containing protein [Methylobacterium gossipiicola]|uniref:PilZ domain-containing protein n=1 Tax=Methylobacterium gossipiicola TaxID=582675 RepID=UPI001160615A|nr:PilZ domain-containing protein [Methylobacterium gossipiicola]
MSNFAESIASEMIDPFIERSPRKDADWPGFIRTADGSEIECRIKNVSKTGARIEVSEVHFLPDTFLLKFGKNFVCRVRLAWRKGKSSGLKVEQITKLEI